jgi:5'(3')-deoxyribonucleotidase
MKKLTISMLIDNYDDVLDHSIIEKLKTIRSNPDFYTVQVDRLQSILFSEEWDFVYDEGRDKQEREKGINPMSDEYIQRITLKRKRFGLPALNSAGNAVNHSSYELSKRIILATGNYTEKWDKKYKAEKKDILYIDMDNVLVDFQSGIDTLTDTQRKDYHDRLDEVPSIFSKMKPIEGAVEAFGWIAKRYDTYILSTAPWDNPSAWTDKLLWVKEYLGEPARKRLILSHHKNLTKGQYIIDDRTKRGVDKFEGMHIHFGTDDFPHWKSVVQYLK